MAKDFLKKFNDSAFAFIKFGKEENIGKLQQGMMYMKNLKYFRELELKSGIKGMGDALDSYFITNNVGLQMFDYKTGNKVLEGTASRTMFAEGNIEFRPVFCLYCVDLRSLSNIEHKSNKITAELLFTNEQKENIIQNFGDTAIVISPTHFLNSVSENFKKEALSFRGSKVNYSDFSINYSDRFESCMEDINNICFWKDNYFEYQREYRFIATEILVDDYIEINIGDISKFSTIIKTEELLNGKYGVCINDQ